MATSTKIYLADFAHTFGVDTRNLLVPLNIGFIKAYSVAEHGSTIDISLFKHPEKFLARLAKDSPEMIGFSNYGWNEGLNLKIGQYVRKLLPDSLILAGGPNVPPESEKQQLAYLNRHDYVDFLVIDGGEEPFSEMITWWRENRGDYAELPQNIVWREGNKIHGTELRSLTNKIDFLPSPYLEGHLDEFLQLGMNPMLETNRGCPYFCTFCSWGSASKSSIRKFNSDTILEEIDYIGKRSQSHRWMVADANFGILKRDMEIARAIRRVKDQHNYPETCHIEMAKNVSDRNIEITRILGDMVQPNMALQSMNEEVLANIKRSNISNEAYFAHQQKFQELGSNTVSEFIVPLPGEKLETHKNAIDKLCQMGISSIINHNLRLLEGAEASSEETRQTYKFRTRYRLIHGDAGIYPTPDGTEIRAFEYEESLRETATMSEAELFYLRKLHFLLEFFWNLNVYKPLMELVARYEMSVMAVLDRVLDIADDPDSSLGEHGRKVAEFFDQFDEKSRAEWFDSPEEIEAHFYDEDNFKRLINHEYEKLNILFSVILLKDYKPAFDSVVKYAVEGLGKIPEPVLTDVSDYTIALFPSLETRVEDMELSLPENFEELMTGSVADYVRSPKSEFFQFTDSPQRKEMLKILSSTKDKALSKVLNSLDMGSLALRNLRLIINTSIHK